MKVRTPNVARASGLAGRGPSCIALNGASTLGRCPNGARWVIWTDDGRELLVCRVHAHQAERVGRLEVWEP